MQEINDYLPLVAAAASSGASIPSALDGLLDCLFGKYSQPALEKKMSGKQTSHLTTVRGLRVGLLVTNLLTLAAAAYLTVFLITIKNLGISTWLGLVTPLKCCLLILSLLIAISVSKWLKAIIDGY